MVHWWQVGYARQRELRYRRHQVKVARLKAKESLAAYYIKSRIEWNLRGAADALSKTHKDEYLIFLWSIPTIGLFVPGLRDIIRPGFEALSQISPEAPKVFIYGWCSIFAATFGVRHAMNLIYPNRAANFMSAMATVPDDVPIDAARDAQANVDASGMVSEIPQERVY